MSIQQESQTGGSLLRNFHSRILGPKPSPVEIKPPPATFDGSQHTDIAGTQIFLAAVQILNSERQALWQRYAAMIVAHTFLINVLPRADQNEQIIFSMCGLWLCVVWFFVTAIPWYYYDRMVNNAASFTWVGFPRNVNPLSEGVTLSRHFSWGGALKFFSFSTILPFVVVYASYLL